MVGYGFAYDYLLMHVPNDNIDTRTLILYAPPPNLPWDDMAARSDRVANTTRAKCAATLRMQATA